MLSEKKLKEVARYIAKCEIIIEQNKDSEAVKAARQYIDNTTSSLALEDLFKLDEEIRKILDK